jgi:hypothetical protein
MATGPNKNSGNEKTPPLPFANQFGLYVIAGTAILGAIGHAWRPDQIDDKTAMFLALAVVALVIQQISEFSGFGIQFKKLQTDVKDVQAAVSSIEKVAPPGGVLRASSAPIAAAAYSPESGDIYWSDPNRNKFGGKPEQNGYRLSATIRPIAPETSRACRVNFKIESTQSGRLLVGDVKIFLHPTFKRPVYVIDSKNGVAEDAITSWGVFTIGAVVEADNTRLELNLGDVDGGTDAFYDN